MAPTPESGLKQRLRRQMGSLRIDCKAAIAEQASVVENHIGLHEEYDVMEQLGQGSSGVVYHARRKADGKDMALKTMRKLDIELTATMRREYAILLDIKHPNIIEAFRFFETDKRFVLAMEFFPGRTLEDAVRRAPERCLAEGVAKRLSRMLLQAIDYLHRRRIVHRDVKADNVLVSHDLTRLKLVDFNTARQLMEGGALTMTGTPQYMAPEVLQGTSPSEASDVWAAGLCLYFMLSGRLPQGRDRPEASATESSPTAARRTVSLQGARWGGVTGACKDFLRRCLRVDRAFRPAPMTLLGHEWLEPGGAQAAAKRAPSRPASSPPPRAGPAERGSGKEAGPLVG